MAPPLSPPTSIDDINAAGDNTSSADVVHTGSPNITPDTRNFTATPNPPPEPGISKVFDADSVTSDADVVHTESQKGTHHTRDLHIFPPLSPSIRPSIFQVLDDNDCISQDSEDSSSAGVVHTHWEDLPMTPPLSLSVLSVDSDIIQDFDDNNAADVVLVESQKTLRSRTPSILSMDSGFSDNSNPILTFPIVLSKSSSSHSADSGILVSDNNNVTDRSRTPSILSMDSGFSDNNNAQAARLARDFPVGLYMSLPSFSADSVVLVESEKTARPTQDFPMGLSRSPSSLSADSGVLVSDNSNAASGNTSPADVVHTESQSTTRHTAMARSRSLPVQLVHPSIFQVLNPDNNATGSDTSPAGVVYIGGQNTTPNTQDLPAPPVHPSLEPGISEVFGANSAAGGNAAPVDGVLTKSKKTNQKPEVYFHIQKIWMFSFILTLLVLMCFATE